LGKTTGDDFADGVKRPGYYLKRPYKRFRTFIEEQNFVGVLKQNCFNVEEVKEFGKPEHPCPYPINLAMFLMLLTTEIGDVCADVYGGIGSLSHAAKVLHRNSISIDVDQVSTKYAINRIDSCDHHIFTEEELDEVESIFLTPIKRKVRSAA
jgi:DNA modification methylase